MRKRGSGRLLECVGEKWERRGEEMKGFRGREEVDVLIV